MKRTLTTKRFEELQRIGLTSCERAALIPCLDNESLAQELSEIVKHCSFARMEAPVTYDEAVFNTFIPEIIKRLMER